MTTGGCTVPGTCVCNGGWSGPLCNQIICAAGCSPDNGGCTTPVLQLLCCMHRMAWLSFNPPLHQGTCVCNDPTRWTGAYCTTPICQGCQYGTCTSPGSCACTSGYTGALCDTPVCATPCAHGACIRPNVCQCYPGWSAADCSTAICLPGCSPTTGGCANSPGNCTCLADSQGPLYSGTYCTVPVCVTGCLYGTCTTGPRQCICQAGWTGQLCDTAICRPGCSLDYGRCVSHGCVYVYDTLTFTLMLQLHWPAVRLQLRIWVDWRKLHHGHQRVFGEQRWMLALCNMHQHAGQLHVPVLAGLQSGRYCVYSI